MGFKDSSTTECDGRVMHGTSSRPRTMSPDDCDEWDAQWAIPSTNQQAKCQLTTQAAEGGATACNDPLVFDLSGNGVATSGLDDPVLFDLDANGVFDACGWTARGSDDAFLFFDRNRNAQVDDGSELFGDSTNLPGGSLAAHDFEALASYDRYERGGNEDGVISAGDYIWGVAGCGLTQITTGFRNPEKPGLLLPMESSRSTSTPFMDRSRRKRQHARAAIDIHHQTWQRSHQPFSRGHLLRHSNALNCESFSERPLALLSHGTSEQV
jgi:hypothetical protein